MHPKDADGSAKSVDNDQTAPERLLYQEESDLGLHCPKTDCYGMWSFTLHFKNSCSIGVYKSWVNIWTATWQNQQSVCAPSKDSDQSGHPLPIEHTAKTLIRLGACPDWSADWAHAQTDLSLRWAHTHFVGFVMSRLNFCFKSELHHVKASSCRMWKTNS